MWNPGFILIIVIAVVGMIVQARLQSVFKKYSQVMFPGGLTGREVAEKMLHDNGIYDVKVTATQGHLTDHYNPATKTVTTATAFRPPPSRRTSAAMPYSMHAIMRR